MLCALSCLVVGVLVGWNTKQPALVKSVVKKVSNWAKTWFGKV